MNPCVKLGNSAAETFCMIKTVFGDCLLERHIYQWQKAFFEGREEVSDQAPTIIPTTTEENATRVTEFLNSDFCLNVRMVQELDIPKIVIVTNNLRMTKYVRAGTQSVNGRRKIAQS